MKGEKTVVRLMEDLKLAREVGRGVILALNPSFPFQILIVSHL